MRKLAFAAINTVLVVGLVILVYRDPQISQYLTLGSALAAMAIGLFGSMMYLLLIAIGSVRVRDFLPEMWSSLLAVFGLGSFFFAFFSILNALMQASFIPPKDAKLPFDLLLTGIVLVIMADIMAQRRFLSDKTKKR